MEGLDLIDRLLELSVLDGRETEVARWLTYDDKVSILDAVQKHGRRALADVTKGNVTIYSRDLEQAVGHDAEFLEQVFLSPSPPPHQSLLAYTGPTKVLLVWADHKYANSETPVIDSYAPFTDRAKYLKQSRKLALDNVIYGYQFCATMQMRTPLRVLEQHRRIERCDDTKLPKLIREQWEGIWSIKTRSFREIGIDIDDFPDGQMASEIGPIDADGGDLLRFMILAKRIARCGTDLSEKTELMKGASNLLGAGGHNFASFMERWGGPAAVLGTNL